ncbi:hypothetical protein LCGC14_0911560 [marine sediment metagenome]|uniref:Uncharacterized protein n=1 Tax=marine sediment metagenome TaxID=412755 RepID=A0A0F9NY79_9ZZZZ
MWVIESKHVKFDDEYTLAFFGANLAGAFPTRDTGRAKIRELYKLDTRLGVTEIKYRVVKYVREK